MVAKRPELQFGSLLKEYKSTRKCLISLERSFETERPHCGVNPDVSDQLVLKTAK